VIIWADDQKNQNARYGNQENLNHGSSFARVLNFTRRPAEFARHAGRH
jgi:hypothetical protein